MKFFCPIVLLLSGLIPSAVFAQKTAAQYPVTYAGGSLPLPHHKVHAAVGKDEVVFIERSQRIAIPVKSITEISYRADVRRRMGAAVLDVVPLMHLGETGNYYIGVSWSGANGGAAPAQLLLKLSRAEYRDFLAALQQMTGIKAVDTNAVPTVVRYTS
jgi:hypothetical protein